MQIINSEKFAYISDKRLLEIQNWDERIDQVIKQVKVGQCFRNSFFISHAFQEEIQYVEGYCVTPLGQALDHAWNYIPKLELMLDITANLYYASFAAQYYAFHTVSYKDFSDFALKQSIAFKSKEEATYVPSNYNWTC